jgi:hypothetical protein
MSHKVSEELKVVQVSTTPCETIYEVTDGESVERFRLGSIVGGQLGLWFENYGFSQRFNQWPIGEGKYLDKRYADQTVGVTKKTHDNPHGVQGPRIEDLTNGMSTFIRYYQMVMGQRALQDNRLKALHEAAGGTSLRSRRMTHAMYNIHFYGTLDLVCNGFVSMVFFDTGKENRLVQSLDVLQAYGHPLWAELMTFMLEVRANQGSFTKWIDLSQVQFDALVSLIKRIVEAKQVSRPKAKV